jgi:cobalt-zinc-cadmium efflux system outer membrane protein
MARDAHITPPPKTPMLNRSLMLAALFGLAGPRAVAADDLTEADVIRLVAERDPDALAAERRAEAAAAREIGAALHPNPSLEWDREELFGNLPTPEDAFSLSIPVVLGGRLGARAALARSDAEAERARAAATRTEATVRALALFYGAVAAEAQRAIAERTAERLAEASRVLGRRAEEGTTSGYERTRIELEAELARSRLREATGRVAIARREVLLLLGIERGEIALSGDLSLGRAPGAEPGGERALVLASRRALSEADEAERRARFAWVPALSLAGGFRIGAADPTMVGYSAGISLELPIFSRGQELVAEARTRRELARAELLAAERVTAMELARAEAELELARGELARFHEAIGDRVARLERGAASGYSEGERSVVELVDVERARESVELRRLALALAAKRAEIALRAARGEFE